MPATASGVLPEPVRGSVGGGGLTTSVKTCGGLVVGVLVGGLTGGAYR